MSRWLIVILMCLPAMATAAEATGMGRVFLSPAERAALDIVRQNNRPPEKIISPGATDEDVASVAAPPPPIVTIHGYVKRADGQGTVWINGQPVKEKGNTKDVEIGRLQRNSNDVSIKLPVTGQSVKLKAGQSYDPATGKVGSLRELAPGTESAPPATEAPNPATQTPKPATPAGPPQKLPTATVPSPPE